MEDNPVQFLPKGRCFGGPGKLKTVFFYPVYADVDFGFQKLWGGGKGKGDNIGVVVVVEELSVDAQQVIIGAKDDTDLPLPFVALAGAAVVYELLQCALVRKGAGFVGMVKADGHGRANFVLWITKTNKLIYRY